MSSILSSSESEVERRGGGAASKSVTLSGVERGPRGIIGSGSEGGEGTKSGKVASSGEGSVAEELERWARGVVRLLDGTGPRVLLDDVKVKEVFLLATATSRFGIVGVVAASSSNTKGGGVRMGRWVPCEPFEALWA